MLRIATKAVAAAILAAASSLAALAAWQLACDPFAALPRPASPPMLVAEETTVRDGRRLVHYVLEDAVLGRIGLAASLPDPLPARPLPVVMVVGGLGAGEKALSYARAPLGENALVAYDWPLARPLPGGGGWLLSGAGIYRKILSVPGQVAAALDWAARQPWADRRRMSLLGFSLGALAGPAAGRLAAEAGLAVRWTVFAYGATDLGALLARRVRMEADWPRPLLAKAANLLLRPLEPAHHLPHLAGTFLLIGGRDDQLFPRPLVERFRALTPEPKTVIEFDGGHIGMGADRAALLDRIVAACLAWLGGQGAINPPG